MDTTLWLLVAAVLGNGLLVGASLDQTIKQLPTRRRGTAHPGCCGRRAQRPARRANRRGLWLALVLTVAHSLATARAAPTG
jgi:hypothetical protein